MKIICYLLFALLLNISTCSSEKDIKEIKFGEGGGFTGAVTGYTLHPNGGVFSGDEKIRKIGKEEMKGIQEKLKKLPVSSFRFNHPGNMYYFIETEKGKITWGDPSFPEPLEIKELYELLMKSAAP